MSHLVSNILKPQTQFWNAIGIGKSNEVRRALDPASVLGQNLQEGKPLTLGSSVNPWQLGQKTPPPVFPGAPTADTAANSAQQTQDMMRRRRGVMANIFAGNNAAPPPTTKTNLGS